MRALQLSSYRQPLVFTKALRAPRPHWPLTALSFKLPLLAHIPILSTHNLPRLLPASIELKHLLFALEPPEPLVSSQPKLPNSRSLWFFLLEEESRGPRHTSLGFESFRPP
ncbi:hypothetical protein BU16DRAFT_557598 [Lophium mytilinum]|uniref:Uncharacterized protein n=1 Tax=Lophium mytilinum TaxID=390894 RepID=A0A6A6R439_9PEZI|nr:hypothetical protein BU16DRAFT_557598 [Lophium mytilinum]